MSANMHAILQNMSATTLQILQNTSVTTMQRVSTNATTRTVSATSLQRNSVMHVKRLLQRKLLLSRHSNFKAI
jgi:hypothetical protein